MRLVAIAASLLMSCGHGASRPAADPAAGSAATDPAGGSAATDRPPAIENRAPSPATGERFDTAAPLHCFSWVHLDDFSTDCFRTAATCEQARLDMKAGSRDVTPACEQHRGSCTTITRGAVHGDERCFGNAGNCERYRAYVTGNGFTTTPCTSS